MAYEPRVFLWNFTVVKFLCERYCLTFMICKIRLSVRIVSLQSLKVFRYAAQTFGKMIATANSLLREYSRLSSLLVARDVSQLLAVMLFIVICVERINRYLQTIIWINAIDCWLLTLTSWCTYFFTLDFGPFNTTLTRSSNIVYLKTLFNLSCGAQANPPASYRFYRGQESLGNISAGNTFETSVVQRTSQVRYSCTPFNHFGDGKTKVIAVEVYCKYSWLLFVLGISLKQPVIMLFYWKEEKKSLTAKGFVRVSLFWNTNMAVVTSCEGLTSLLLYSPPSN